MAQIVKPNVSILKVEDLLGLVKKEKPEFLGKMPEKKAVQIVRAALIQLGKQLESVKEGVVKVPALGNFRIHQVQQEKAGRKETVKRVLFRGLAPKPKTK